MVLLILNTSVIWSTGAPTPLLADVPDAVVAAVFRYPNDNKLEENKVTTARNKDLLGELNCDLHSSDPQSKNLKEVIATVALFYVDQSNFIFIAIDPFDDKYFGKFIAYTGNEFNLTKMYEDPKIDEDYAGLVRASKVNKKILLDLNGISPSYKESK